MVSIGTVKGQEIRPNRKSINVRMLTVQFSNESDTESVEYISIAGDDSAPMNEDKVFVFSAGEAFKFAVSVRDAIVAVMGAGERKLYSRDSGGNIAAFVNLLTGGDVELNGNGDFAVRFTAMESAFNTLKADLNAHGHTDPQGGSVGPSLPASVADISGAKVDEVKLP